MGKYQASRDLVRAYFDKLEACSPAEVKDVLREYMSEDYVWEGVYPFLDVTGSDKVAEVFWEPLKDSVRRMQRRQDIFMAGTATDGKIWVMSMGQFMGLFDKDFLGIRRTRKMQHLQYAEFSCVENGKITHTAMFIDLLGFMKEAGQYPLAPETGSYFVYPGPRDHNGLMFQDAEDEAAAEARAKATMAIIDEMSNDLETLTGTNEHPREMLERTWTDDMIWYGPCGIGASYTIPRYQEQHQIPFRTCLSDIQGNECFGCFAEGDFACFFASQEARPTGGWLGTTASGDKSFHMRGDIDIYYCKNGKISENWCFIDLPYWLSVQGYDVFKRTASILNPADAD